MLLKNDTLFSLSVSPLSSAISKPGLSLAQRIEWLGLKLHWSLVTLLSFVIGAAVRSVAGLLSCMAEAITRPSMKTGMGLLTGVLSVLVLLPALAVSFLQQLLLFQSPPEPLTGDEKYLARIVFGSRFKTDTIRIIRKKQGLFKLVPASFVLGNLVYLKTNQERTLVHEWVHCWQYQNLGIAYAGNALLAQWIYGRNGSAGNAYDWKQWAAGAADQWLSLNAEAAAELIEDTYVSVINGDIDFTHSLLIKNAYQTLRQDFPQLPHR